MSKGWEVKTLGELCTKITDGSHNPPKGIDKSEFLMLSSKNIGNDVIDFENPRFLKQSDFMQENKRTYVSAGDVLLTIVGTIGRCAVFDGSTKNFTLQRSVAVIRPDQKLLDSRFLMYSLQNLATKLDGQAQGVAQKGLYLKAIKNIVFPVPHKEEQKQLVDILDKAFADLEIVRANAEANLKNAQDLFESYLNEVFVNKGSDWQSAPLGKHVKFVDYRGKTPPKRDSGVRLITAKNVKMGYIKRDPEEFIDVEVFEKWLNRGKPLKGDVLFTTEAPLGNVAILDTDERVVIGQRLITLQPENEKIDRKFLAYLLMSRPIQNDIHSNATGATVQGIKAKLLKEIPISFPSNIEFQRKIADEIEAIQNSKNDLVEIYSRKIKAIDNLKQSVLAKAFSGELLKDDNVIQLNISANSNTKAPEFMANIIAYAHLKHKMALRDWSFKRVKAQKFLHLVESIGGIDLGRQPRKLQYGPHDENHMNNVQEFAKEVLFFEFVQRKSGHAFAERLKYNQLITEARKSIEPFKSQIDKILEIIIPMDSRQAEVFATVHAAWNNLLLDGKQPNNDEIIYEARENWHPKKLDIPKSEFETAIKLIKSHGVEPKGEGKRVIGNEKLL